MLVLKKYAVFLFEGIFALVLTMYNCLGLETVPAMNKNTDTDFYIAENIIIPKNGLNPDEKNLITYLETIHNILCSETNWNKIIPKLRPTLENMWGQRAKNSIRITMDDIYCPYQQDNPGKMDKMYEIKIGIIENTEAKLSCNFHFGTNKNIYCIASSLNAGKDEPFEGIIFTFHPNGQMESVEHYNDQAQSIKHRTIWDENGNIKSERIITVPEDIEFIIRRTKSE